MSISTEEKDRYLRETAIVLAREGFQTGKTDTGKLRVLLDGAPLCEVTENGGITYRNEDINEPERVAAKDMVYEIVRNTAEYKGAVASWRNTVTVENVHPNTTVSFRMNNLSGDAAGLKLYAYGADGTLAEVSNELWSITDEAGSAVDTLSDGTLYELRVSVADGGAFDLSETEKEIKISVVLAK